MDTPRSPASEILNRIDALWNLVYLMRHDPQNSDAMITYIEIAKSELARLSETARLLFVETMSR
jgi:hypothetical protein